MPPYFDTDFNRNHIENADARFVSKGIADRSSGSGRGLKNARFYCGFALSKIVVPNLASPNNDSANEIFLSETIADFAMSGFLWSIFFGGIYSRFS